MAQERDDTSRDEVGHKRPGESATDPTFVRKRPLKRLAHELKAPISAMAAAADVMRHEQLGPIGNDKYLTYANDIHSSAVLVLALIDRMMAHRGGDEAAAKLDTVEINMRALVSSLCSAMKPLAQTLGIELRFAGTGHDKAITVLADDVSLRQILLNLLNNSLKFSSAGGFVEVDVHSMSDGGVQLSVSDNGQGMTAEQIEVALSGETVPMASRQRAGRGLGIGLPLVRALCEANGAVFTIASEGPTEGTTASILFPRDRVVAG